MLYQWLMNQEKLSSLFTTMSEMSAKKLCKEMEFLHLNSGEVVVNQGEKGSTCFILMSGVVSVYVRSPEEQIRYQRIIRSSSISSSMRRLSGTTSINYGNKVITLTPGATFGELCLIEPDSKRSATVIVDPQAQMANFIVLTAASYLRMTRSQTIEGTITDNIAFLQHLLIFKHWTKMQLMHIVNSMKLVNVSAGLVTKQWQEAGKSRALRLPQRPMTTPSGKRAVPLAVTSITHSTHVSRRQEDQRRQLTQRKTRPIQEELQYIRDTWPYCWNNDDDGQQDATTGMLARLRSRSRSPSPTLDRRRSQPGRHDSGSLSART
uniref:Cyclic nucleotide-binding domain-containing protein n=1 Tax=Phytophthora fragariae TaxID=53985 RepID=A0A6A3FMD7_9STRA|nr:hypothetical protein PF009_g4053 [Phytophthora fragariae]